MQKTCCSFSPLSVRGICIEMTEQFPPAMKGHVYKTGAASTSWEHMHGHTDLHKNKSWCITRREEKEAYPQDNSVTVRNKLVVWITDCSTLQHRILLSHVCLRQMFWNTWVCKGSAPQFVNHQAMRTPKYI